MNAPLYTLDVLRLAGSLPGPVKLERVDGSASKRSSTCGSIVATDVQLDGGTIHAISQTVSACAFGQASAALVAQQAAGRTNEEVQAALNQLTDWLTGTRDLPPDWPGFEALAPARSRNSRHGAILLPLQALVAAIEAAG